MLPQSTRTNGILFLIVMALIAAVSLFFSRRYNDATSAISKPSTATTQSVTIQQPQPSAPPAPVTNSRDTTILELFSPSDPYLTKQLSETAVAQQIEQLLTTSFVLRACTLITEENYRDNFHALITYAQQMKLALNATAAEARVRLIAQSASASYSLVYGRTPCNSPQLPAITQQFLAWQQAYLATPR